MPINSQHFDFIRKMVRERSAIVLEQGKEYLVESRLWPVINREGLGSIEDLVNKLKSSSNNSLAEKIIDAMTTNETSFFRDIHPFEALKKFAVPDILKKRSTTKTLNIWCGASSSGQEPYSVAMLLKDFFPDLVQWQFKLISSDISQEMLKRCKDGFYSQLEVNRGLPASMLVKYFQRSGSQWQIKEEIRRMIEFREINLAENWPIMPNKDIIKMRNVLIYIDLKTKKKNFWKNSKFTSKGRLFIFRHGRNYFKFGRFF